MNDDPGDRTDEDPTDRTDTDPFEAIDDDHDADPFEAIDDHGDSRSAGSDETDGVGPDLFAELEGDTASSDPGGDPFERMEVDSVDVDGVWDALDEDFEDLDENVGTVGVDSREATDHVVDKQTYCHRCPYFADPPETACTHEDASILEALGFEEFRLRDCPMVTDDGPRFDRHGRVDE